ncbi:MAG TPA: MFS transporter [Steroidobacteraceae bacterium]|nr:MFS transporter [Steroidobacteraceae bacterium]
MGSSAASGHGFTALRHRDFALYLVARFVATLAVHMQTVAVGWQVYAITGDPLDLGLVGLSQFLPFVLMILPAGQAADHYDRRRIVTVCYAVEALCGMLLLAFSLSGRTDVWPVFAVMILFGTARAFAMPTGQALVPNLVPPQHFGNAVALSSSSFQVATIVGPTLGGLLYLAGPAWVYGCVAGLLLVCAGLMASLRSGGRSDAPREPATLRTLLSGLAFVRSRPLVLGAISLDLFAVLFGGATALLPVYASDILDVGPGGLGLLRTAPGVGAALCAAALAFHPITTRVGRWMFVGVLVFGVATLVFGASRDFVLSMVALVLLGAGDMVSVYIRHLLVQLETPDAIRGRVSAVNSVFIGASNELGEFRAGVMAAWWGSVPAVLVGGAATLAIAGLWVRLFPGLWRMQRFPDPR